MNYVWQIVLHVLLFEDRSVIVSLEDIHVMGSTCLLGFIKQRDISLFLKYLSALPVMHIIFWFKVYAMKKLFSVFLHLWRSFQGLEKILLLIVISPKTQGSCLVIPYRQMLFRGFWPVYYDLSIQMGTRNIMKLLFVWLFLWYWEHFSL